MFVHCAFVRAKACVHEYSLRLQSRPTFQNRFATGVCARDEHESL